MTRLFAGSLNCSQQLYSPHYNLTRGLYSTSNYNSLFQDQELNYRISNENPYSSASRKPLWSQALTMPYVTSCRKSTNSTFCPHIVLLRFVWFSAQTVIIPLHNIQWPNIILNSVRQHNHFITQGNYKATCFDYRLVILRPILSIVSQDARHTLESHPVYIHGIHQIKSFVSKDVTCSRTSRP